MAKATSHQRAPAAAVGLACGLVLMTAAIAVPAFTGWDVHVRSFPPLHARWAPRVGPGSLVAVGLAFVLIRYAGSAAHRLSWPRLLLVGYLAGFAWLLSLATVDGLSGVGQILDTSYEYLPTVRATGDFHATLQEYVSRIPYSAAPDNWPVHIAGHPPGALGFFVLLDRIGLSGWLAAGVVVTALAASTAVAVLVTLRRLGAEAHARAAAPFLIAGPAAIWQSVSADAMFAAVAAWGLAALAAAATSTTRGRRWAWSVAAGGLLGYTVLLSYGLVLMAILALTVLAVARDWRPLLPTAGAAAAVVVGFALAGFAWWEALPVLRERYWDGVASRRPAAYWMWGDLAALLFSAGPLAAAGVGQAISRARDASARIVTWLARSAILTVLVADASQMSRAEVERIWLPFVPWLLIACALLPERWRRRGFAAQLVIALVLQHLLRPDW